MDERPFPHGPLPLPPPSRRGFFVVGGLAAVAAGGGAWWALSDGGTKPASAPTALLAHLRAATAAEMELVGTLSVALKHASGSQASVLREVHADHVAHAKALQALAADVMYPAKPSASSAMVDVPSGRIRMATLRAAEKRAARIAAHRAATLTGQAAVLLASIAACEATHAELMR